MRRRRCGWRRRRGWRRRARGQSAKRCGGAKIDDGDGNRRASAAADENRRSEHEQDERAQEHDTCARDADQMGARATPCRASHRLGERLVFDAHTPLEAAIVAVDHDAVLDDNSRIDRRRRRRLRLWLEQGKPLSGDVSTAA